MRHDCSTLGGNSGSVVLSLETGEAVGLHFAGRFLEANFAVPSTRRRRAARRPPRAARRRCDVTVARSRRLRVADPEPAPSQASATADRIIVPLSDHGRDRRPATRQPAHGDRTAGREPAPAARRRSTRGRRGLRRGGAGGLRRPRGLRRRRSSATAQRCRCPASRATPDDVLTLRRSTVATEQRAASTSTSRVLMSSSRRLCRFSAVNIDGTRAGPKVPRAGWRTDPRIPPGRRSRTSATATRRGSRAAT